MRLMIAIGAIINNFCMAEMKETRQRVEDNNFSIPMGGWGVIRI